LLLRPSWRGGHPRSALVRSSRRRYSWRLVSGSEDFRGRGTRASPITGTFSVLPRLTQRDAVQQQQSTCASSYMRVFLHARLPTCASSYMRVFLHARLRRWRHRRNRKPPGSAAGRGGHAVLCLTRSPDKTEHVPQIRRRRGVVPVRNRLSPTWSTQSRYVSRGRGSLCQFLDIGAYKYRRSLPPRIPASRQRTGIRRLPIKANTHGLRATSVK